jgi:hypothetical protein
VCTDGKLSRGIEMNRGEYVNEEGEKELGVHMGFAEPDRSKTTPYFVLTIK